MIAPILIDVAGLRLSALEARPAGPAKGLVLALHGGGYRAGYWDYPPNSLLPMAAARGFHAVAVDRPGYGAAFDQTCGLARQAEIVFDVIDHLKRGDGDVPVLVAGHSMGGILALMMAASARSPAIAAVDACGVPLAFQPAMAKALAARRPQPGQTHYDAAPASQGHMLFYGPQATFDPAVLAYDDTIAAPVPVAELPDGAAAPDTMPAVMAAITLPVRLSFAAFEGASVVDDAMVARARGWLAGSARAEVRIQPDAGHNISLHRVGADFHRGVLNAFEALI
ncbi:MAG: alpha/beta hydrolase [Caulobacterales bacterium]|nr:alpha/beta hydrolase [Caulobacterales bacterium]